jgi:predicted RNA-binding protein YlqC (UPF0109 family)
MQASVDGTTAVVETLEVPDRKVGYIIGASGSRIRSIKEQTKASVHIEPPVVEGVRKVTVWGSSHAVAAAVALIHEYLTVASSEDQKYYSSGVTISVEIDPGQVGRVIGRGGEHIRDLQVRSGAHVHIEREDAAGYEPPPNGQRRVLITGTPEAKDAALQMIDALLKNAKPDGLSNHVVGSSMVGSATAGASSSALAYGSQAAATAAAAANAGPPVEEAVSISDSALSALMDPANPTPLGQLQASGVTILFSRTRTVKRPRDEDTGSGAGGGGWGEGSSSGGGGRTGGGTDGGAAPSGSRTVRLSGGAAAVHGVRAVLGALEAQAAFAKAHSERTITSAEEALYTYYAPFYERAGLPYAAPAKLWQDEVDAEASRYKMWANYYSQSQGVAPGQGAPAAWAAAAAASQQHQQQQEEEEQQEQPEGSAAPAQAVAPTAAN